MELCGGTHVGRTGEIGLVTLVGEAAVAAGVRRVEALTGAAARHHLAEQDKRLREIAGRLKVRPDETVARVDALVEERRRLERELADAKKKLAMGGGGAAEPAMQQIGAINVLARAVEGVAPKDLRGLVDQGKRQVGSGVVAIVGVNDGKAGLVVGVTDDLTDRISAVDLARVGSVALGGTGGGGRPDLAQAGGPNADAAEAALKAITGRIEEIGRLSRLSRLRSDRRLGVRHRIAVADLRRCRQPAVSAGALAASQRAAPFVEEQRDGFARRAGVRRGCRACRPPCRLPVGLKHEGDDVDAADAASVARRRPAVEELRGAGVALEARVREGRHARRPRRPSAGRSAGHEIGARIAGGKRQPEDRKDAIPKRTRIIAVPRSRTSLPLCSRKKAARVWRCG